MGILCLFKSLLMPCLGATCSQSVHLDRWCSHSRNPQLVINNSLITSYKHNYVIQVCICCRWIHIKFYLQCIRYFYRSILLWNCYDYDPQKGGGSYEKCNWFLQWQEEYVSSYGDIYGYRATVAISEVTDIPSEVQIRQAISCTYKKRRNVQIRMHASNFPLKAWGCKSF